MTKASDKFRGSDVYFHLVFGLIFLYTISWALWGRTAFGDRWLAYSTLGWLVGVILLYAPFLRAAQRTKDEQPRMVGFSLAHMVSAALVIVVSVSLRIVGGAALASESTPLMIYHPRGDGSFETMTSQHWGVTNWKTKFYRSSVHLQRGKLEARIEDGSVVEIPAAFESYEYFLSPEAGYQKAIRGESGNISSDSLTTQTRFWLQGNPQSSRLSIEDLQKVAQERFDEEAKKIGYVRKQ